MHRSAAILFVSFAAIVSGGECGLTDEPLPLALIQLLKPNMRVGVRSTEGTAAVVLNVYSEEQFAIAQDVGNLTLDQLKEKYAVVDKQFQQTLQHSTMIQREKDQGKQETVAPRVRMMTRRNELFATIKHVGHDYILITFGVPQDRRQALPIRFVSRIEFDALGVQLYTYAPRARTAGPKVSAESQDASNAQAAAGDVPEAYIMYATALIRKYDVNSDGVLTREEWMQMNRDYSSADTDKDGNITPAELGAALAGK